jgi:hypothetical protein
MGRRNYFLVVSLLVMLGALIGAILWSGSGKPDPEVGPAASASDRGGSRIVPVDVGRHPADQPPPNAARAAVPAATTPAIAATTVTIRGRLTDGSTPAANVELRFSPSLAIGPELDLRGLADRDYRGTALTTDAGGRFSLELPAGQKGRLVLTTTSDLLFADGPSHSVGIPGYARDTDLGDLGVTPASSIAGIVRDEIGMPLEGARVVAARGVDWFPGGEAATTDAEGRFRIPGLGPGEHRLSASAPGFVPIVKTVHLEAGRKHDEVVVALRRGASIGGTVIDDRGRPIQGAKVASYRERELGPGVNVENLDSAEAVETDASGYFVLAGLEADNVVVRVWANGHGSETQRNVQVGRGDLIMRLERFGRVSGSLIDVAGKPIAGSNVTSSDGRDFGVPGLRMAMPGRGATTDADGRFVLENVRAGTSTLTATGKDHRPVEGVTVQVRPGESTENVRLVADVGTAMDVLVVDPDGTPVANAEVRVVAAATTEPSGPGFRARRAIRADRGGGDVQVRFGDDPEILGHGKTDAEGRVRIGGLPAASVSLSATHDELAASRATELSLPHRGVVEAVLTLRPGGFVALRVIGPERTPRPATRFRVVGPEPSGDRTPTQDGETDGDGNARLGPLPEGTYTATLRLPPRARSIGRGGIAMFVGNESTELVGTRQSFAVRPGTETEVVLVHPTLTRLHGIVSGDRGPAPGIEVSLRDADDDPMPGRVSATTDERGEYDLTDLAAGSYRLEYGPPGAIVPHEARVELLPGVASVRQDLTLGGGFVRAVVVSLADAMPLSRAEVSLQRAGARERSSGEPPRRVMMVSIDARRDDTGSSTSSITMGDGMATVRTDDDGVAVIDGVPAGEYTLVVRHPRHVERRVDRVTVVDRAEANVGTVELESGGFLRGRIVGLDQDGMGLAMVEVADVGGGEPRMETAMRGAFRVDGLRPGKYRVRARPLGPDGATEWGPEREVEIEAGKTARIDVPVRGG